MRDVLLVTCKNFAFIVMSDAAASSSRPLFFLSRSSSPSGDRSLSGPGVPEISGNATPYDDDDDDDEDGDDEDGDDGVVPNPFAAPANQLLLDFAAYFSIGEMASQQDVEGLAKLVNDPVLQRIEAWRKKAVKVSVSRFLITFVFVF